MLGKISRVHRNKVKAMVVKTRCSEKEIQQVLGESFGKIMAYMSQMGSMPAGAPYVAYFNEDMNDLQLEVGIPTAVYMPDTEEVVLSVIPEGEYLSSIYTGPYSDLKEAYREMTSFMKKEGLEVKDAVYESYLNDPGDTPEEKLMTEILFSLK